MIEYQPIDKDEIPGMKGDIKRTIGDFIASGDDAWEIKSYRGNAITAKTAGNAAYQFRTAARKAGLPCTAIKRGGRVFLVRGSDE